MQLEILELLLVYVTDRMLKINIEISPSGDKWKSQSAEAVFELS
jgi:hypothetical protein